MRPRRDEFRSRWRVLAALAVLWLAACGGGPSDGPGDSDVDAGDSIDASVDRPDATSFGHIGDDCTQSSQCRGALVCDPETNTCAEEVSCAGHDDCGLGSHCTDDGRCASSGSTSPCGDDDNCAPGDACFGGFCGCAGEVFEAELVDVNMLILLDRSGSMSRDLGGSNVGSSDPTSRWQIARGAIESFLDAHGEKVNLGFALYPGPDGGQNCSPGEVREGVSGDTTTEQILAALDPHAPQSASSPHTPSGPSLDAMAAHDPLLDPDVENVILYITDGEENCSPDSDTNQAAAAGRLFELGIRTFVVGFSDDIGVDELNATAEAAGTAREDPDDGLSFYLATDAESLEEAFDEIAGEALACAYELSGAPTEPDNLHVYVDKQSLIRDSTDGWEYDADANRITVHGVTCDALRGGDIEELAIVQTCETVID